MNNHYFYRVDWREKIHTQAGREEAEGELEVHHRWKNMECESKKMRNEGWMGEIWSGILKSISNLNSNQDYGVMEALEAT